MNSFEAMPEADLLPVDEVITLHNFIMGDIRKHRSMVRGKGVRRKDDPRGYAFCMLNANEDTPRDNTGSIITYLGVLLTKHQTRHWSMLVSFLDGYNTQVLANTNYRTCYRLDWTRTAAQGVTWGIETIADKDSGRLLDSDGTSPDWEQIYKTGSSVHFRTPATPMDASDIAHVQERVASVSMGAALSHVRRADGVLQRRDNEQFHSALESMSL